MSKYLAPVSLGFLALTIVLGGASSQGLLGNALLQVLAVVLIFWVLMSAKDERPHDEQGVRIRWVGGAVALLAFAQFIPLSSLLWPRLPGREVVARGFDLLGMPQPWQTLSMSPWSSLSSLTWCLPAIAMFMLVRSRWGPSFSAVAATIALLAGVSILLGLEQIISGSLYGYQTTNLGKPVGFFANVNHQASFVVCALVLWVGHYKVAKAGSPGGASPVRQAVFYSVTLYFVVGVILCGSVAGAGLLVIATAAIGVLSSQKLRARPGLLATLVVVALSGAAIYVYAGPSSFDLRVDTNQPGMSRIDFWSISVRMLTDYLPVGSGLGTFEELYHLFENPETVGRTYVNHAHNDYLELLIETGLFGVLVLLMFFLWFVGRLRLILRDHPSFLFYACGMIVLLLALHSWVDYPLRTAALSSVFAAAVGFLARRPEHAVSAEGKKNRFR